ncbi:MAG: hydantoinase/oxoprolinase family protein [Sphaerobacter sp.]|nr:hydantoinase/oxoprolinase family protein [Sphaerobacter sp.]
MEPRLRVGIDIGGTFTDLILVDDRSGTCWVAKTLTTADDPAVGVRRALLQGLELAGAPAEQIRAVIHGTTLVTNAIIERKGDKTALVTTAGFRDAVEIAREHRYDMYDIFIERPKPIAPRHLRFEVNERLLADGSVYRPVDPAEVEALAERLRRAGVEAIAICFLHSYRNPAHERQVAAILAERLPGVRISLSSEVVGEIREYERTSTTLANVYVQRIVEGYLDRLQRELTELGSTATLLIMLSSGGICTVETARRFPVRLIESGPAAGALAAAYVGRLTGRPNLLAFDMGGTTAKACLIEQGRPLITTEFEVDRVYRFKKGSGLPIKASSIELIEIGAGGGSIAHVDQFGLIKIGPDSAGSQPGPACYGLGGTRPTVTDADLVLGYLDPDFFLGGTMQISREAAEEAIEREIARPLGLSVLEAAWSIHHLVNENMASAARIHAVEHGKDVRAYPLFASGGAGPVHAYRVAELLGIREILCPFAAGVGSSIGFLAAPLAFDFVRSAYARLDQVDWDTINALYREMEDEGRQLLAESGVPPEQVSVTRTADMRLLGQAHEIRVPIPGGELGPQRAGEVLRAFETVYRDLYKRARPGVPIEIMSWRVLVSGPQPELTLRQPEPPVGERRKGQRPVYFPEFGGFHPTPVYDRYQLRPGDCFDGPAIIEERESTVVVGPRGRVAVDQHLNLVIRLGDGGGSPRA